MNTNKLFEFSTLVGRTITKIIPDDRDVKFYDTDKNEITVEVYDDGCGGNDSHADFVNFDNLNAIIGEKIIFAESNINGDETYFTIKTETKTATFQIFHEHNGYYGYSFSVFVNGKDTVGTMNDKGIKVGDVVVAHGYTHFGIVLSLKPALGDKNELALIQTIQTIGNNSSEHWYNTCYLHKVTQEILNDVYTMQQVRLKQDYLKIQTAIKTSLNNS